MLVAGVQAEVMWDYTIWRDATYCQRVALNATKGLATKQEEAGLCDALNKCPDIAPDLGLEASLMPELVKHSQDVAFALLVALNTNNRIDEYVLFTSIDITERYLPWICVRSSLP